MMGEGDAPVSDTSSVLWDWVWGDDSALSAVGQQ